MIGRVFKAFAYRDFRIMWFGACTSSIGTLMQTFAQAWLVLQLTKSPFLLGLDSFLGSIPIVLFSLVGGVFADRTERQKLLLGSQFIQMACAFSLASLFATGVVKIWQILTLSFIVGTAQSFGGPAYSALIPTLVKTEDLPNAIALNSIQFNVARVLGPNGGRRGADAAGSVVVLRAQRRFVRRGDHFAADHPSPLRAQQKPGIGFHQHEGRISFHPQPRRHGSADRPGVHDDAAGLSLDRLSAGIRQGCFSRRPEPLYSFSGVLGHRVYLWRSYRGGAG